MFENLDDEDSQDSDGQDDDSLQEWKHRLRADFELWLDGVTTLPNEVDAGAELEGSTDSPTGPDLYSFYAELASSNAETKKANRRTAEVFSQWGDTLGRFDASLTELQKRLDSRPVEEAGIPKSQLLTLVEMVDRIGRMADAFEAPPPSKRSLFGGSTEAWEKGWSSQKEANRMLLSHLLGTLQNLGVRRISTQGETFDPATMAAVAAEAVPGISPHKVLEELASGWTCNGKILRPAQVKVSRG